MLSPDTEMFIDAELEQQTGIGLKFTGHLAFVTS